MTSLKEEEPFACVVGDEFFNNACSFCLLQGPVQRCKGCNVLSYCNKDCQKSDWVNHKLECRVLKKQMISLGEPIPNEHIRLTIRILLKSEEAFSQKAFNDRTWDSLEDRGKMGSLFDLWVGSIVVLLKPAKNVDRAVVAKVFSKVVTNSMKIIDTFQGVAATGLGLYLGLSIHKQSCIPNSQLIFTGKKASLRAFDEKAVYSTNLTISYTHEAPWIPLRRLLFWDDYHIDCSCALCADKKHIMNRMGSSCFVSCCKDAVGILDENSSGPYRCNKCGTVSPITVNDVISVENKIKRHLDTIDNKRGFGFDIRPVVNKTPDIILASEKVLSVYNFIFVNLCKSMHWARNDVNLYDMRRYAQDKYLHAAEYYLHEKDRRRVAILRNRFYLKQLYGTLDEFDYSQVLSAEVRTFGEGHPAVVKFKEQVEHYDPIQSTEICSMLSNLVI